jgi:hypothetical protein
MQANADSYSPLSFHMSSIAADVLKDSYWGDKIRQLFQLLGSFDSGITEEFEVDNPQDQRLQRIVRFCVPLFELCKETTGLDFDPSYLAAMYLWQEVWQPLDNILDREEDFISSIKQYNVCLLRAYAFHSKVFGDSATSDFLTCLFDNLEVERNKKNRADPSLIFLRVRLYEVVLERLPEIPHNVRAGYRSYINAIGTAHDFVDVIDDLKAGQITFSTEAFRSIDEHLRFHHQNFEALRSCVREEFRKQELPLRSFNLESCWIMRRSLNAYYDWAFSRQN